ncbi:MAG: hypothetical protein ING71_15680 [Rhodocyclaceae bacterium]|nr:hypothetical protein [Rhodocyclaceae bacterium]
MANFDGGGTDGSMNPVHSLLDQAGIPWRETRRTLIDQFGIEKHPAYGWDVINFSADANLVGGMIYPLSAQAFPQFSTAYPATEFSSVCYFGEDERKNIQKAAKQLARKLGPAPVAVKYNTLHCEWKFGAASVSLTTWPADMQRGPAPNNPSQKKDPRLVKGCHLNIQTGFCPAPTPPERAWLDSFVPVCSIQVPGNTHSFEPVTTPPHQSELEFVREPGVALERVFGKLGVSADRAALIFSQAQTYIVPVVDLVGFRTERLQPAKGPGGSYLQVECRTHYAGQAPKILTICSADGPDDLNEITQKIAAATGRPFSLSKYYADA